MSYRLVLRGWRSCYFATLRRFLVATIDVDWRANSPKQLFATEAGRKGGLADAEVESAFLRRFADVRKNPDAAEVVRLFRFLASESADLNSDGIFVDLCDFAATVAQGFDASDIELIFRICYKRLDNPHVGLLHSIADVLIASGDLTPFPSSTLVCILSHISRRRREEAKSHSGNEENPRFFPEEDTLVRLLLEEVTHKERLEALEASDTASAFCSAAALQIDTRMSLTRLRERLCEENILPQLSAKEIAYLAYMSAMFSDEDPSFVLRMAQEFPRRVAATSGVEYLGMLLYSLVKCKGVVQVPSRLQALCNQMQAEIVESFPTADLVCLFYSLGRLAIKNDALLEILSKEVCKKSRLESMEGRQLLSILHAIQQLNYVEDPSLISALSHEILTGKDRTTGKRRLERFKTFEICGILHAFSRLGMHMEWCIRMLLRELICDARQEDLTKDIVSLMIHSMGLTRVWDHDILSYLKTHWLTKKELKNFEDPLLSMMISGFSRFRPTRVLAHMSPIVKEMVQKERLERCSNITLTSVIHGLAVAECGSPRLVRAVIDEASKPKRIESMSERSLSLMVYSLGRLQCLWPDGPVYCIPFVKEALKAHRLTRMDNQGLSNMILGLGKVRYRYNAQVLQFIQELLRPHRSDGLKEKGYVQLCHTVFALANLRIQQCDAILDSISAYLLQNGVRSIAKEGLAYVVAKLAHLDYRNVEIHTALVREAIRREGMRMQRAADMPLIVESIGRLKFPWLFGELITSGLRELDNLNCYQVIDLKRLLNGFAAMKGSIRPDLMHKLEKRLSQLTALRGQSTVLAVK